MCEAEAQRPRQATLEGKRRGSTLTTLLLPADNQCSTTQRGLLESMSPLVGKKKSEGGKISIVNCLWYLYSSFAPWDLRGICRSILGIWLCVRRGKELLTTSTQILADEVHTYGPQVVARTSSLVHPQNEVSGAVWPGNSGGCKSSWFGSSKEEFC